MGILSGKNIVKKYGKDTVLKNVNIDIETGKIYGLIGRNGAGKTTLLSILTAQNPATEGSVTLDGEQVWENEKALSRRDSLTTAGSFGSLNMAPVTRLL